MSDAIETQGFMLEIGDVGDSPAALTEIKEITNFSGFDGQAAEIDVTHLQSTAKEFIMGLQDFGQFQIDTNYLPDDPGQTEARAAKGSRVKKSFLGTFSDGSTATFEGYVVSAPASGAVDDKVSGSFVIRITGAVTFS